MVIVNFVFGILIFQEPVADIWGTLGAFVLLIVGLVGMSKYSAPQRKDQQQQNEIQQVSLTTETHYGTEEDPNGGVNSTDAGYVNYQSLNSDPLTPDGVLITSNDQCEVPYVVLFSGRLALTQRQCGILGAAMNGVMTGGSLIPLHYAKEEGFGGAKFFPSMACGALLSNALLWFIWFGSNVWTDLTHGRTIRDTYHEMPKWEFRILWLPGFLAGLLLSLAMFTSILAVTYLGQGVGNSVVQTKILVSGLWGIFWYHEIVGFGTISKWFTSAGICVLAIIWLSLERMAATGGGGGH